MTRALERQPQENVDASRLPEHDQMSSTGLLDLSPDLNTVSEFMPERIATDEPVVVPRGPKEEIIELKRMLELIPASIVESEKECLRRYKNTLSNFGILRSAAQMEADEVIKDANDEATAITDKAALDAKNKRDKADAQANQKTQEAKEIIEYLKRDDIPVGVREQMSGLSPDQRLKAAEAFATSVRATAETAATKIESTAETRAQAIRAAAEEKASSIMAEAEEQIRQQHEEAKNLLAAEKAAVSVKADQVSEQIRNDIHKQQQLLNSDITAIPGSGATRSIIIGTSEGLSSKAQTDEKDQRANLPRPQSDDGLKGITVTSMVRKALADRFIKSKNKVVGHSDVDRPDAYAAKHRRNRLATVTVGVFGIAALSIVGPDLFDSEGKDNRASAAAAGDNVPDRYSSAPEWAPLSLQALQEEMAAAADNPDIGVPYVDNDGSEKVFNLFVGADSEDLRVFQSMAFGLISVNSAGHPNTDGGVMTGGIGSEPTAAADHNVPTVQEVADELGLNIHPNQPMSIDQSLEIGLRRLNEIAIRLFSVEDAQVKYGSDTDPDHHALINDVLTAWGLQNDSSLQYAIDISQDWQRQDGTSESMERILNYPESAARFEEAAQAAEASGIISSAERN